MSLRKYQEIFSYNVGKLIIEAYRLGFTITLGEAWRTPEQQYIYYSKGHSNAKRSLHQDRLAIDINLFKDGFYLTDSDDHRVLGLYWEKLHPYNRWGGHITKLRDGNHYELKPPKQ